MPNPTPHRVIIVVEASDKSAGNTEFKQDYDPRGGELTFNVGLSPTGEEPWTHFWASGVFSPSVFGKLQSKFKTKAGAGRKLWIWDMDKEPDLPDKILKQLNLKRPVSKMQ